MRYFFLRVPELLERCINLHNLTYSIDSSTPMGILVLWYVTPNKMERELIVERTKVGLETARVQWRIGVGDPN